MSEHDLQVAIIEWAHLYQSRWPQLELLHAIPNGGYRHAREAHRLRKEGVLAGIPDLCLPVARKGYHGLYIELKYGRNRLTNRQKRILGLLDVEGYKTAMCNELSQVIELIEWYLDSS